MGYSDQKFYDRPLTLVADSSIATGTATASGVNAVAAVFGMPTFPRATKVNSLRAVVKTAGKAGTTLGLTLYNGTTAFATIPTGTASAGSVVAGTLTNTAVLSTNTFTNTLPNGSTVVLTNTTTTDYSKFAAAAGPSVNITGTATASADTVGAHEIFFEAQELYS